MTGARWRERETASARTIVLRFVKVLDSSLGSCINFAADIKQALLSYDDDLQNKIENRRVLEADADDREDLAPLRTKGIVATR